MPFKEVVGMAAVLLGTIVPLDILGAGAVVGSAVGLCVRGAGVRWGRVGPLGVRVTDCSMLGVSETEGVTDGLGDGIHIVWEYVRDDSRVTSIVTLSVNECERLENVELCSLVPSAETVRVFVK